jgi:shikimate dehydrogenase
VTSLPTRRAGVLGHPVAHSLSPVLHRAAYTAFGLDWRYERHDVTEQELPAFLAGLGPEWVGLSLTMPLKEAVLPLLDDIEPLARQLRSVNTVLLDDGRRVGRNTDVPGLVAVLAELGIEPGVEVTLLGGGATARSALAACGQARTGRVTAYVRRPEVASDLARVASGLGVELVTRGWGEAAGGLTAGLVIATVPGGAADSLAGAVPPAPGALVEVLYAPWPTPLADAWQASSGQVAGGLELLVHQAVEQVRLLTGRSVPPEVLRTAGEAALAERG